MEAEWMAEATAHKMSTSQVLFRSATRRPRAFAVHRSDVLVQSTEVRTVLSHSPVMSLLPLISKAMEKIAFSALMLP
eukprot:772594-Amphidinium_carterae.1